jgi:hypothetical protein
MPRGSRWTRQRRAPEICREVAFPGNTTGSTTACKPDWPLEKAVAYLAAGATELVIVELDGRIRYFDDDGEREGSAFGIGLTPQD